jgi:CheY-like chemotaxis protein
MFPEHVLLIEDDAADQALIQHWAQADWPPDTQLTTVISVEEGLPLVQLGVIDCVLLDLSLAGGLSDIPAIDALMASMPSSRSPLPLLIVSGADVRRSTEALRHGAQEWVGKNDPQFREQLTRAITHAWARYRYREHRQEVLRHPLPQANPPE